MLSALFARGALALGELLDAAFRLLRMRFGAFVLLSGIFSAVSIGLEYIGTTTGAAGITNLGGAAAGIWQTAALLCFIFALLEGATPTISASLSAGLGNFWRLLGLNLLQGIAIGLSALPGAFLMFAAVPLGPIGMAFGFLLILAPVIYLGARWCVAGQVLIGEESGVTDALGRSWGLTQGYVWRCIGYYVLVGALSLLFLYLPLFLAGALLGITPREYSGWVQAVVYTLAMVLGAVWVPFSLIAFTLLYYDLRVRNEGLDLELQVAHLEEEASRASQEHGDA